METINGCTVIASSENPITHFGPIEMRGAYVAEIGSFPPGEPGPPVHFHPHTDEAFYVADGEATFLLGDREHRVTNGGFVFIPRGTVHTVWNSGDVPVRGLIIISPGDAEHEFALVESEQVRHTDSSDMSRTLGHQSHVTRRLGSSPRRR